MTQPSSKVKDHILTENPLRDLFRGDPIVQRPTGPKDEHPSSPMTDALFSHMLHLASIPIAMVRKADWDVREGIETDADMHNFRNMFLIWADATDELIRRLKDRPRIRIRAHREEPTP